MSKKLKSFFVGLQKMQEVTSAFDEAGIDLDRLIHISNAQGKIARIVRASIIGAAAAMNPVDGVFSSDAEYNGFNRDLDTLNQVKLKQLGRPKTKSSKKKTS